MRYTAIKTFELVNKQIPTLLASTYTSGIELKLYRGSNAQSVNCWPTGFFISTVLTSNTYEVWWKNINEWINLIGKRSIYFNDDSVIRGTSGRVFSCCVATPQSGEWCQNVFLLVRFLFLERARSMMLNPENKADVKSHESFFGQKLADQKLGGA